MPLKHHPVRDAKLSSLCLQIGLHRPGANDEQLAGDFAKRRKRDRQSLVIDQPTHAEPQRRHLSLQPSRVGQRRWRRFAKGRGIDAKRQRRDLARELLEQLRAFRVSRARGEDLCRPVINHTLDRPHRVLQHLLTDDVAVMRDDQRPNPPTRQYPEHHRHVGGVQMPDVWFLASDAPECRKEPGSNVELGDTGPPPDARVTGTAPSCSSVSGVAVKRMKVASRPR